jgi:hypothetical protein
MTKDNDDRRTAANLIKAIWQGQVESIVETGRVLIAAKEQLDHREWLLMFELERMPFGRQTAEKLMTIARDPVISATVDIYQRIYK